VVREVHIEKIIEAVKELTIKANYELPQEAVAAFKGAVEREESELGREVLSQILLNAQLSAEEQLPYCQDTGVSVVFLEVGQDVNITGGSLIEAVNEGVRRATEEVS
jgi:fumarate hydratase subunit alpha